MQRIPVVSISSLVIPVAFLRDLVMRSPKSINNCAANKLIVLFVGNITVEKYAQKGL